MQWGSLLMLGALACGRTGLDGDGPATASTSDVGGADAGSCTRGFGPPRTFASKAQLDDAVATPLDVVVSLDFAAPPYRGSDVGTANLAFDGTISQPWHHITFSGGGGGPSIPSPMQLALGPSGVRGFISEGGQCTVFFPAAGSASNGMLSQSNCFAPLGTGDGFTAIAQTGDMNADFPLGIFDPLGKLVTVTPPLYSAPAGSHLVRAGRSDDSFLVAWGPPIMVQHFGKHGEHEGAATLVLSDPAFGWLTGLVALATTTAGAVVVWSSANALDTVSSGVWVRALDHDGVPVAAPSRVLDDWSMVAATSIPSGALVVARAGNRVSAFIVSPDGTLDGEVMSMDAVAPVNSLHVVATPTGALVLYATDTALWAAPLCVP